MAVSVFDLFKIGIGPSSSHTVGPMRAAGQFIQKLQEANDLSKVARIKAELYGSLGATGKGHATDIGVLLGLLGETPESVEIAKVPQIIQEIKTNHKLCLGDEHLITFSYKEDLIFYRREVMPEHPNGMKFTAFDAQNQIILEKKYLSVGGGFIVTVGAANNQVLVVHEQLPYPFKTGAELLEITQKQQLSIAEVMMANEQKWNSITVIHEKLDKIWQTMQEAVLRGTGQQGEIATHLPGPLSVQRRAPLLYKKLRSSTVQDFLDPLQLMDWVNMYAMAVNEENAAGGRVVTAPTNGAAGIIPAVLHYYIQFVPNATIEGVRTFLLTSAAVGILYKYNASISGAEVGCQGEVGVASSMAAAGLAAVLGGTPMQVENAAEIAMEHHLGLTCDPVGGLVQIPCIERNAMGSMKAINAARMALYGDGQHYVSLDMVIKTMKETGADMKTKYKETSRGGLAVNIIEC